MFRLFSLMLSLVAPSLMGVGIIAVLTAGYGTLGPILAAAAAGAVLALPVAWLVARKLAQG